MINSHYTLMYGSFSWSWSRYWSSSRSASKSSSWSKYWSWSRSRSI